MNGEQGNMKRKWKIALLLLGLSLMVTGCRSAGMTDAADKTEIEAKDEKEAVSDFSEKKEAADPEKDEEDGKEQISQAADADDETTDGQENAADNPLKAHGALSVKGTQLVDAKGKAFQLRGVSTHGLNWFPQYVNEDAFRTMKEDWKINCVRLAMYTAEGDSYCEGGNQEQLKNLVSQGVEYAADLGLYVIIDWHVLHDCDPNKYKSEALEFFDEMAAKYADYDNVLYEICNEPNGGTSWEQVKSYANEVIPVIRKYDADAVIIVGTPNWSQDVDIAAKDPVTGYDNIMYTIHFYADTHRDDLRTKMKTALDAGLPVFCSEFGICDASGAGANNLSEGNAWIEAMNDAGVSYCIWNLSNKPETSSLLKSDCQKTSGWTKDDLSEAGLWYVGVLGADTEQLGKGTGQDAETGVDSDSEAGDNAKSGTDNKAGKEVTVTCSNQWSDGQKQFYQYDLTISNTGKKDINDWSVQLDFACEVTVDQSWNGNFKKSGKSLVVTPADYNQTIGAGQSVNAGLIVYAASDPGIPQTVMSKSE